MTDLREALIQVLDARRTLEEKALYYCQIEVGKDRRGRQRIFLKSYNDGKSTVGQEDVLLPDDTPLGVNSA